jgi:tetratricopeptide (TPR) repeat protein
LKRIIYIAVLFFFTGSLAFAQKENAGIRNGNKLYKQNNFEQSISEYKKAISLAPANPVPQYNLGNAHFRANQLEEAAQAYEGVIGQNNAKPVRQKAFYNQGVAMIKQQKLQESINAWKNALKLDPNDNEARENLQKALTEQKKQQQEDQKKDNEEKKEDKKKQDKDQKKPQQQPQQQPSKLNKKQVEQLLKALAQKEKEVQQKMQAKNSSPSTQDKDW